MSFSIFLKQNLSEKEKVDKVFSSDTLELVGTLREATSLQDPVVTLEISDANLTKFAKMNYADIPAFGRSYFITEAPRTIANHLWEVTMHVDVLSSFKTEIRANDAIIARNQKMFNLLINDSEFRVLQNPFIKTIVFPETPFKTTGTYILLTAGGAESS